MTNKILIPVDFQEQAQLSLLQSYNLARRTRAEIILLYVHEQPGILAGLFSHEQQNEIFSKIDQELAELAGKSSLISGIPITYRIEKGRIYSKIIEVARETDAGFIIMGTHGSNETEDQELRVGANTSKVIRSAICPVITLRSKHPQSDCRNILLPIDLTKETQQKVTKSIEIAKLYGAGIRVVTAIWTKNDLDLTGKLQQKGDEIIKIISAEGIACTFDLVESNEKENTLVPAVLDFATQQGDIDLILVLTQQEIGIVEYFVGSHAQEFIRLSHIPVMSIIPKDTRNASIFS